MAVATEKTDETFELTDIRPDEVSLVNAAANLQDFLIVKEKGEGVTTTDSTEIEKTEEQMLAELAEKDAKDKAEYVALKAAEAKDPAVAPAVSTVATVATETAAAPAVVPAPETETEKEEPVAPVASAPAPAAETPSAPVVETAVVVEARKEDPAPPSIVDSAASARIVGAWLGGIAAIRERIDMLEKAVKEPIGTGEIEGNPCWQAYAHVEYLHRMLNGLMDIGGPEWDVEAAAQAGAAFKAAVVSKVGRAISGTRMQSLKEIRTRAAEINTMLEKFFSDLDTVEEPAVKAAALAPAVTPAPVAAPAVTPAPIASIDIESHPAFKALKTALESKVDEQSAKLNQQSAQINELNTHLAKARSTVRSNALTAPDHNTDNGVVKWEHDMGSKNRR